MGSIVNSFRIRKPCVRLMANNRFPLIMLMQASTRIRSVRKSYTQNNYLSSCYCTWKHSFSDHKQKTCKNSLENEQKKIGFYKNIPEPPIFTVRIDYRKSIFSVFFIFFSLFISATSNLFIECPLQTKPQRNLAETMKLFNFKKKGKICSHHQEVNYLTSTVLYSIPSFEIKLKFCHISFT